MGDAVLSEELLALAATAGTAVAQAAGTDAWSTLRAGLGRWFGRGDAQREEGALAELDATADALGAGSEDGAALSRHETEWRDRVRTLLQQLRGTEQEQAARVLRELLSMGPGQAVAGSTWDGGLHVQGDVDIHAEQGSVAAGVVNGSVSLVPPQAPVRTQG